MSEENGSLLVRPVVEKKQQQKPVSYIYNFLNDANQQYHHLIIHQV